MTRSSVLLGVIAAGILVRVVALPLPGTGDMRLFRTWTYGAATLGPAQVYGTGSGFPTWRQLTYDRIWPPTTASAIAATAASGTSSQRRWLIFDGDISRVDYPPGALYALAAVGSLYQWLYPTFPPGIALTVAIKLLLVLAGLGLAIAILYGVKACAGVTAGRAAALAFWANPAVILHGPVLGYLDVVCALPAVAALLAATRRHAAAAGLLLAVSCMIKPQGLLLLPALIVALSSGPTGAWRAGLQAAIAGALTVVVCILPIIYAGALGNLCAALAQLVTDGQLSGTALNAWWLVTFAGQTAFRSPHTTLMTALRDPVTAISIPDFFGQAGADPTVALPVALMLGAATAVLATVAWATWQGRRLGDLPRLSALAAFTVHAYAVLAVQVHENHLYLALPFLAVAAVTIPRYRILFAVVSAIAVLNLNMLYGLGEDIGYAMPRDLTGIDTTVIVAVVNCAALVWHARTFKRICSAPAFVPRAVNIPSTA